MSQFHHSSFKQAPTPRIHINLPKINIKSFEGDPLEWLTFWDSFSAAIDKNLELSDVEKMNYLNGMLKGASGETPQEKRTQRTRRTPHAGRIEEC